MQLPLACPRRLPSRVILGNWVRAYNCFMQKKIFWIVFLLLGLLADILLPLWWGIAATIPIVFIAWWVAYRSDWF